MRRQGKKESGFSLIEIIVTLIIVAVVGTLLFTFLRGTVVPSSEPVFMAKDLAEAQAIMEENAAVYSKYLSGDIDDWGELKSSLTATKKEVQDEIEDEYDFKILEVTISFGDQKISALFTQ
ncbi:prepilin-type N-terminal cleavage/methylation domain-containing protein [Desulfovermiculus halophilus]|jgi:prepilin-type N-terminal cleavage/methylation domain-containing protein|uniref:prepilin-type N-terminal cleavage/methylation domain-containing protein n=1 Tax=Desulfovermiculus halophilus TaxID=339722 RepID=UPI000485AAEA|nr:prepilin-type N-terminal cleavage/methylation domain-containing protein [Desulfovermiculus halophilus]